jgi:hypothetical protein
MKQKQSRSRHQRYSNFNRLRKPLSNLREFLKRQNTRLTPTASSNNYTNTIAEASQVLTFTVIPTDGKIVTIGTKIYTFQDTLTEVDGHVHIGATLAASITNLANAIKASGGTPGTDYASATTVNTDVTAVDAATTLTVTALIAGTAANSVVSTTDVTGATWGAGTLAGGVDDAVLHQAAHGYDNGEGPYNVSGTKLNAPFVAGVDYYVNVIDAGTYGLTTVRGGASLTIVGSNTGTQSIIKCADDKCIHALLDTNRAETIIAATDIDALK